MTALEIPQVLLLTRTPPGHAGAGGVFLYELWKAYPQGRLHCFTVARERRQLPKPEIIGHDQGAALAPRNFSTGRLGPLGGLAGLAVRAWQHTIPIPRLLQRIARFGKARQVDMLWAVLNDPITIRLAAPLSRRLGAPLVLTVWDPPEAVAGKAKLDDPSRRSLLGDFDRALRASIRCGVASEGMADEYQRLYGIEPIVQIHGMRPSLWQPPSEELTPKKELILGFAGSVYTQAGWQALFEALDTTDWEIGGRAVHLRILGHGAEFFTHWSDKVELLGWRTLEETVQILAQTDVTYLPYWFTEAHADSFRLCFPNKLTTYLAAGKPVFYHGPAGSSADRFFQRFPAAIKCHSHDPSEILDALRELVQDPESYAAKTRAGRRALREELSLGVFRRRFASLIGIDETVLTSLEES